MKADIEVRQLRAFLAVVAEGTVGGAARALGLAQSTVSEALAALDRALGTPAIRRIRGAQRATLTAAGRALMPHAQRALEELEAARTSIAAASRTARAHLEILANESVSTYLLPAALDIVRESWPGTRFTVSIETCAAILSRAAGGRGHIGLMLEADVGEDSTLTSRRPEKVERHPLRHGLDLVIIASPSHPLSRQRAQHLGRAALNELPIFVADGAGDFHDLLANYFAGDGGLRARLEPVGTIEAVRRGAEADASALGILPYYAVAEDLRSGRLRQITVRPPLPRLKLTALVPAESPSHPAIAELIERLRTPKA
jgi:DNA-binding transcriptional LysR family regulator